MRTRTRFAAATLIAAAGTAGLVPATASSAETTAAVTAIGTVQGAGASTPFDGRTVTVEGIVTGDFQVGGFDGYYVQDAGDADAATSDGIFVHAPGGIDVTTGDRVRVTGAAGEFRGLTQVRAASVAVLSSGNTVPRPIAVTVPLPDAERYEGMLVTVPRAMTIVEYFDFDRYGEIVVGTSRQDTPTAVAEPGPAATAVRARNLAHRITLDDGRSVQNPDPALHPNGRPFTMANRFRGGDTLRGITGVLDFRNDRYKVQQTKGATYRAANPRPQAPPPVGGTLKVASFNVLNYFTTLGRRGADTAEEFRRQEAKIAAAITRLDADVVGLIEIENNGAALTALVDALNAQAGAGTYAPIVTGRLGTDEITTAFVYRPARTTPVGAFAAQEHGGGNRPTLLQTFADKRTGGRVDVAVNHLKSKGSACAGDPDTGDGQGNCNRTRTAAARQMAAWLATDPTGSASPDDLILGDLNAYDHEEPIDALVAGGYTDLVKRFVGKRAYSYVFDGMVGYLDHALASATLTKKVTGAAVWHINADEPDLIDYDMTFKAPAQDALYAPDPYRSSDHDPILVGLDLRRR